MNNYSANLLVGRDMDVIAVAGDKETNLDLEAQDGDVVGISIGESYTRQELGQVNLSLSISGSSSEIIRNTPLTQFIPDGERQMWPMKLTKGAKVKAKLTIRVAGLLVAKPIPLIFHHDRSTC